MILFPFIVPESKITPLVQNFFKLLCEKLVGKEKKKRKTEEEKKNMERKIFQISQAIFKKKREFVKKNPTIT